MKNNFHTNQLLLIYETVTRCGDKTPDGYCWEGITVTSSHDGYEIYLAADGVLLTLGFHNKYQLKYEQRAQVEAFEKRINDLFKRDKVLRRTA